MADIRRTGQLDDFSWSVFPYENPISHGGAWANVDTFWTGLQGASTYVRANNFSWSYWTAGPFDGDVEVWAYGVGGGLGAAGEGWRLGLFQSVGGSNSADGYQLAWFGNPFGGYFMRRYDNTSPTNIGTGTGENTNPSTYILLFRRTAATSLLEGYISFDNGANWTLVWSATDGTYTGPFYLAIAAEDPSDGGVGWTGFGGGTARQFVPQIYRIIKGFDQ